MANHNWKIGQDIVCIKTHSEGVVKEGEIHTIKGLRISGCKCKSVDINVGLMADYSRSGYITHCPICNVHYCITHSNTYWIGELLFAPLDTLTDITEIEEILKQPIETLYQL